MSVHFQKDEVGETALAKPPSGAETSDASANDDDWNFLCVLRGGKAGAIAQEMAHLEGIVDERASDRTIRFERESN